MRRTQFQIAPDYARTAYSTQGLTLGKTLVDLNFDDQINIITAYVALSRVKRSEEIIILQKFKLETFQTGDPDLHPPPCLRSYP